MAASTSIVRQGVPGDLAEVVMDITGDASYPTGGYAVTVPLSQIVLADITPGAATGHPVAWDYAAGKLKVFTSGGAEVAAATNLSTMVVRAQFYGKR